VNPIGLSYVLGFLLFCLVGIAIEYTSPMQMDMEARPLRVDLQTAPASELEILPGIGPKMAQRIIAYRKLHTLKCPDDLLGVFGIGQRKVDLLRRLIAVEESAE
jgi:DNA uptake protein ComE-like DNA-binding protein